MDDQHAVAEAMLAVLRDPSEITSRSAAVIIRAQTAPEDRRRLVNVLTQTLEIDDQNDLADLFLIAAAQRRMRQRDLERERKGAE